MRITRIHIKNYLNFRENLEIQLTYPEGHPKCGEPLDKICFIGQSSTGKTSLLNLIKYFTFPKEDIERSTIQDEKLKNDNIEIYYRLKTRTFSKRMATPGEFN